MWETAPEEWSVGPGIVHLWRIDLTAPPQSLSWYRALLSPEERQRADRFYFQKDRDQFTVGRGTLWDMYGFIPREGFMGAVVCDGPIEVLRYFWFNRR